MIYLLLDFLLSYILKYPTYLILLNVLYIQKKDTYKIIEVGLILDLIFFNTYFVYTLLLFIIYMLFKKRRLNQNHFLSYLLYITIIYILFTFSLGFINHYSILYILYFCFKNYFINVPIYIICYKIRGEFIKFI